MVEPYGNLKAAQDLNPKPRTCTLHPTPETLAAKPQTLARNSSCICRSKRAHKKKLRLVTLSLETPDL